MAGLLFRPVHSGTASTKSGLHPARERQYALLDHDDEPRRNSSTMTMRHTEFGRLLVNSILTLALLPACRSRTRRRYTTIANLEVGRKISNWFRW
jgi:hypothetical protein